MKSYHDWDIEKYTVDIKNSKIEMVLTYYGEAEEKLIFKNVESFEFSGTSMYQNAIFDIQQKLDKSTELTKFEIGASVGLVGWIIAKNCIVEK